MTLKVWTKTEILDMLNCNDLAVEAGILAINKRQTQDELHSEATIHHNGMGWNGRDAKFGTSLANWIEKSDRGIGDRLSPKQLRAARRMLQKYAGQLTAVANEREKKLQQTVVLEPTGLEVSAAKAAEFDEFMLKARMARLHKDITPEGTADIYADITPEEMELYHETDGEAGRWPHHPDVNLELDMEMKAEWCRREREMEAAAHMSKLYRR